MLNFGKRTSKAKADGFLHCSIQVFDIRKLEFDLKYDTKGEALLKDVCVALGDLLEIDYFGLRLTKRWLLNNKLVWRQLKKENTTVLQFLIKHYPANPLNGLMQDIAKYYLYKQLRYDLFHQKLIVNNETLSRLIALIVEAESVEMLNASTDELVIIVNELDIIPNVSIAVLSETLALMDTVSGMERKEAEIEFIRTVSQLESYGVEPNRVLDQNNEESFLTFNHEGLCLFSGEKRIQMFYWENISSMQFKSRTFEFVVNVDYKKTTKSFKFETKRDVKSFWLWAVERQIFMTLNQGSDAKVVKSNRTFLRQKIKHRFYGKTQKELITSCQTLESVPQPEVVRIRHPLAHSRANSLKAVCRDSLITNESDSKAESYATIPRQSKSKKRSFAATIDFKRPDSTIDTYSATSELEEEKENEEIEEEEARQGVIISDKKDEIETLNKNVISNGIKEFISENEKNENNNMINSISSNNNHNNIENNNSISNINSSNIEQMEEVEESVVRIRGSLLKSSNQSGKVKPRGVLTKENSIDRDSVLENSIPNGIIMGLAEGREKVVNDEINFQESGAAATLVKREVEMSDSKYAPTAAENEMMTTSPVSVPFSQSTEVSDVMQQENIHHHDNMFLMKFVILITLLLLFVMITSLIIYYHYRSATIADLNKRKFESESNKHIDLESIKRFILRNDDP